MCFVAKERCMVLSKNEIYLKMLILKSTLLLFGTYISAVYILGCFQSWACIEDFIPKTSDITTDLSNIQTVGQILFSFFLLMGQTEACFSYALI